MSWTITGAGASPRLLDAYPGAAAAYSLRNLSWAYGGPVVRVRRSSDNTEQDFTAVQVADGTLTTFCGASNGFVRTWYDQSGNGRNAVQTTNGNQPQIVSSGVINLANSKPCLTFNGTSNELAVANRPLTGAASYSFAGVATYGSAVQFGMLFVQSDGAGFTGRVEVRRNSIQNSLEYIFGQPASVGVAGTAAINATQRIIQLYTDLSASAAYVNASLDASASGVSVIGDYAASIGARSGSFYFSGSIQEVVVWRSSLLSTRSNLQSSINAYYTIY